MCRAGGRRCPNAGGRSTQNTRKAVSRARRALRDAQTGGDATAIDTARQRLAAARTAHREAKEAMRHNDNAGRDGDVTDNGHDSTGHDEAHTSGPGTDSGPTFVVHNTVTGGARVGSQHAVSYGDTTFVFGPRGTDPTMHRIPTARPETPAQQGDVTGASRQDTRAHTVHVTNTNHAGTTQTTVDLPPEVADQVRDALDLARHLTDVRNTVTGTVTGQVHQSGVIVGGLSFTAGEDGDVTGRSRRTVRNTASGDDHIGQQIGIQIGRVNRTD